MSMESRVVLVSSLAWAIACTHERARDSLPARAGSRVAVELATGETVMAVVGNDANFILRGDDGRPIARPIATVTEARRGRGALEGVGLGAVAGGAAGALVGLGGWAIADAASEDDDLSGPKPKANWIAAGAILVGGVGAVVGAVYGGLTGSKDVYRFGAKQEMRFTPSGPPGSTIGVSVTF